MAGIVFNPIIAGVIVCVVLVLLCLLLFSKSKTKSMDSSSQTGRPLPENGISQTEKEDLSDETLIAVLTAAVMASMQNSPDIKIRVTSFRRIPQSSPVWNTVGRRERMENKL